MSFECDNCGKNLVNSPGEWCSECQEREQLQEMAEAEDWFSQSKLCQRCDYAWGGEKI